MAEVSKESKSKKKNPLFSYFSEVKTEMTKVVWPTKKTVINHTIIVIAISLFVAGLLGGLDVIFTKILNTLITT